MRLQVALLSAIAIAPAGAAFAEPAPRLKPYLSTATPAGASAVRISRFVGVETQAPPGADAFSRGLQRELDQDRKGSAFGVAYVPVAPRAQVFARVGYGAGSGIDRATADEAWKFGAGAQYSTGRHSGIRADFTRFESGKTRPKANVLSMGFVQKF